MRVYGWVAVYVVGIAGSVALSAAQSMPRRRACAPSIAVAVRPSLLFFAFGYLCRIVLGHFGPRQLGTFWPIYFMLFYSIAGLWFGYAFIVIGLGITALTLIGYFYRRRRVPAVDGRSSMAAG